MNNSYYNVSHSRDYYKGKSVEFAGEWTSGVRYFNDEYLNSLVVYTEKDTTGNIIHSALLACKKTHIAAYNSSIPDSTNNQPHLIVNDNLGIVGIEPNDYWIFVSGSLEGTPGKSAEIVNTYLEALTLASESNIGKIVFVKEEKDAYLIIGAGELKKIVSLPELLELASSKVDKEIGKGLSTNDYSNSEKAKLKEIEENAQRNIIEEIDLNGVKIEPVDKVISINADTEVTEGSNSLVTSGAVYEKLELKQDTLTAGNGINIENNKISVTTITESETQPNTSIWVNPAEDTDIIETYNRSQIDALVSSKQDIIDDLESIREKANKGATALQPMQNITYAELISLRNSSSLVSGRHYRITDYQCTTTQESTQSAGHQFDIIVRAGSVSTLNEEASAIQHEGDEYFTNSNLSAWKIWYCLDNDKTRFAWADETNGKGVIYRMIDEFNNDIPYDFKNIQFKHPDDTTIYHYYYTFSGVNNNTDYSLSVEKECYSNTIREYVISGKRVLNNILFIGHSCYNNSFGFSCYNNVLGSHNSSNTFGSHCHDIIFNYYCVENFVGNHCSEINMSGNGFLFNNRFGDNCNKIRFESWGSTPTTAAKNYNFVSGLSGNGKNIIIKGEKYRNYETRVEIDSNGVLKTYCLADLIESENNGSYPYSTSFIGEI